jgi:Winged helix DNA-binding domain
MNTHRSALPRWSWAEVWAQRLERHALSAPLQNARPADIVATICGAHAQLLSAAEWSIGLRLAGSTRADVRHALWSERSLVKTLGPRGTVHVWPHRICRCGLARWLRFRIRVRFGRMCG